MKVTRPSVRTPRGSRRGRRAASHTTASVDRSASKMALARWCHDNQWKVVFFEGASGHPRTGIVDAVMIRIKPAKPDTLEVRLMQLKAGMAGYEPRNRTFELCRAQPSSSHSGSTFRVWRNARKVGRVVRASLAAILRDLRICAERTRTVHHAVCGT
jgi:hypothetical protein